MGKGLRIHPDRLSACMLLAGDHMAGVLLYRIAHWAKYANAKIPKIDGTWIANKREWWCQQTVTSPRQCDRAMASLWKKGLIEKRQWWWGGQNILHIRPTGITEGFLGAAKTWPAALELAEDLHIVDDLLRGDIANIGHLASPILASSNEPAGFGLPGSPETAISNNIKDEHFCTKQNNQTAAYPASPSCGEKAFASCSGQDNKKMIMNLKMNKDTNEKQDKKQCSDGKKSHSSISLFSPPGSAACHSPGIRSSIFAWRLSVAAFHAPAIANHKCSAKITPKDAGTLAELVCPEVAYLEIEDSADPALSKYLSYDLPHICDVIAYTVESWAAFRKKYDGFGAAQYPNLSFFCDHLGQAINDWTAASCPSFHQTLQLGVNE